MNIENMKKLIGQLDRLPDEKFKMQHYIRHHCGTTACIAGWCSLLNGGPQEEAGSFGPEVADFACDFLGLSNQRGHYLFSGMFAPGKRLREITRKEAISELKRMVTAAETA